MSVKLAIVYYSATGTIQTMAERVHQAAEAAGAEVRLRHVAELAPDEAIDSQPAWRAHVDALAGQPGATPDDVVWADAVVFGTPTRFGNVSAQLKQFIDTCGPQWGQGLLADKVYSGFTATATTHGGQESTLLALYNSIYHFGGLIAAPGYTDPVKFADGNPYGTSHVAGQGDIPIADTTFAAARYQGERVAKLATALKAGLDAA